MSLSDIMGAAGLTSWAEVGLIISLLTFSGIVLWVFLKRKSSWEHLRRLPLDDGTDATQGTDADGRPAQ